MFAKEHSDFFIKQPGSFSKPFLAGSLSMTVAVLVCFVCIFLFCYFTGFNGLYGQDAHEYLRYTKALVVYFKTGTVPSGHFYYPVNYPLCGAVVSFLVGNSILALQLVSIASFVLTFCYIVKTIGFIYEGENSPMAILYSFLFFILSPFLLREGIVDMSDMLCMFFVTASINHVFCFHKSFASRHFYLALFFGVSAVMTRYAAAVILFIPMLFMAVDIFKRFKVLPFVIGLLIVFLTVLPHFILNQQYTFSFLQHPAYEGWSVSNMFSNKFDTIDGHEEFTVDNILSVSAGFVYPGFIFIGIVFLPFLFWKGSYSRERIIVLATIGLYAIFIAGIPYQNMRILSLYFPLILIFYYPSFLVVSTYLANRFFAWRYALIAVVILVQFGFIYRAFIPFYEENKVEKEMAAYINTLPPYIIYTIDFEGALRSYDVQNPIRNMYFKELDSIVLPSYALLNREAYESQWQGQIPMKNWEKIKLHHLHMVKEFNNCQLYEVR